MQIILREDVKDLGRSGELVTVAEGYARNFLLPRKLAVQASPGAMKDMAKRMEAAKQREAKELEEARGVAERMQEARLTIAGKAAEGSSRLHGSITQQDIAELMSRMLSLKVDKRDIEIREPIRTLGTHQVVVKLAKGVNVPVTVEVVEG
jgi:large subunit ribosomal protein L9